MEGVAVRQSSDEARRPTVWVAHDTGDKNLTPASDFGDMRILMRGTSPPVYDAQHIVDELMKTMSCDITGIREGDFLLLVGNPSICAIAAAIASRLTMGRLQLLQWDRQERRYIVVKCVI